MEKKIGGLYHTYFIILQKYHLGSGGNVVEVMNRRKVNFGLLLVKILSTATEVLARAMELIFTVTILI